MIARSQEPGSSTRSLRGSGTGRAGSASGFTLAEIAITVLIVGITMVLILQGLGNAKLRAVHTRNLRLARELGSYTLGEIEAGLYWDDIDSGITGEYEDHPEFSYEIVLGDDTFADLPPDAENAPFDNWAFREEWRRDNLDIDEDEEDEIAEPFEKVRVRVLFPKLLEQKNELVLERWIPWEQVYGPEDEALLARQAEDAAAAEGDGDGDN